MNLDHLLQQLCPNAQCITTQDRMLSTINTIVAHDRAWQHGVTVYQAFIHAYQQNIRATKKMSVMNYLKRVHALASLHYGESVANRIFSPRLVLSILLNRPLRTSVATQKRHTPGDQVVTHTSSIQTIQTPHTGHVCSCHTPDSNASLSVSSPCSQLSTHDDIWLAAQGLVALCPCLNEKRLDEEDTDARIDEDTRPPTELPVAHIPNRGKKRLHDEAEHESIDALSFFKTLSVHVGRTLPSPAPMHPHTDQSV